jgi:hypothetical protein
MRLSRRLEEESSRKTVERKVQRWKTVGDDMGSYDEIA